MGRLERVNRTWLRLLLPKQTLRFSGTRMFKSFDDSSSVLTPFTRMTWGYFEIGLSRGCSCYSLYIVTYRFLGFCLLLNIYVMLAARVSCLAVSCI